jgi:hypothetical protein
MSRDAGVFGGAAAIPKRALLDLVAAELTYRSSDNALAALYSAAGITPGALRFATTVAHFGRVGRAHGCAFAGTPGGRPVSTLFCDSVHASTTLQMPTS